MRHIQVWTWTTDVCYAALCADRADRAEYVGPGTMPGTATAGHGRYVGTGHTPGAELLAAGIAEDIATNHEIAREEREVAR
ncbi:hypothetical protein GCM10010317_100960 [Streptomyces mirabilis]|nr:hypothetical protein GCM10010317_100960 [Streptomyces mirabilis]